MASLATAIMHTVSVMIGAFLAYLIPKTLIQIIVITLFTGFGIAMLYKSCTATSGIAASEDDKREIQEELEKMEYVRSKSQPLLGADTEKTAGIL